VFLCSGRGNDGLQIHIDLGLDVPRAVQAARGSRVGATLAGDGLEHALGDVEVRVDVLDVVVVL
jgi:hypothetical protein